MTKYDPLKKYTWSRDQKFEITGEEFNFMLNAFRSILSTKKASQILLADRANMAIERIMQEGVKNNTIKETEDNNENS